MKLKKVAQEQKIWDEKEKAAKSEKEAKKLVPQRFHKQIHVFGKKASKRVLTKKLYNYIVETKKEFVLRKKKVYLLLREKRKEV